MKQFILKNKNALAGFIAILLIGVVTMSFQDSPFSGGKFVVQEEFDMQETIGDTVPDKKCDGSIRMKDFDKLQSQLDRSLLQVNDEIKKIDFEKIQKQVENTLKDLDMEKIMKDVENSLKTIDLDKLLADVTLSLKDFNWEAKEGEMEKALAEAKKEIEKARIEIKDIDREAIKKELGKAKIEIEKSKIELKKIDVDKIMNEAKAGIGKAREELKQTKEMFNELEKDGLVNAKEGFVLEYKDKALYIDGKKQSERTTDKYRKYFKKDHFKMTIEKE
ncbi:MAG TPA: hypothetical protein VK489_12645 [Ferruginibacter sp.]|nr:hypothetical protein [Ferruginibacter sp.]